MSLSLVPPAVSVPTASQAPTYPTPQRLPHLNPPATLQTLPYDVFHLITRHLDYRTIISLSTTNRAFHLSLDPDAVASTDARRSFYLKAERFPQHRDRLTCFTCYRLLPSSSFGERQARGRRGKNGSRPDLASTRFCWECASAHRLYEHLRAIKKGGLLWYLCHRCGEFKLRSQRCERDRCSPPREIGQKSAFEMLPLDLQKRIFGMLDYEDAIYLSQTNQYFHSAVKPVEDTTVRSRYLFVRRKEEYRSIRTAVRWGCFSCFKVKTRDRFPPSADRLRKKTAWMRRCLACTQRQHAGTPEGEEELRRWKLQRLCRLCRDLRVDGKECGGCVRRLDRKRRNGKVTEKEKSTGEERVNNEVLDGMDMLWRDEGEMRAEEEAAVILPLSETGTIGSKKSEDGTAKTEDEMLEDVLLLWKWAVGLCSSSIVAVEDDERKISSEYVAIAGDGGPTGSVAADRGSTTPATRCMSPRLTSVPSRQRIRDTRIMGPVVERMRRWFLRHSEWER
jgi:hypothetical protein